MCERCELMWDKEIAKQQERAKALKAMDQVVKKNDNLDHVFIGDKEYEGLEQAYQDAKPGDQIRLVSPAEQKVAAKKNDDGKLRYDLIPQYPLSEVAKVYTIGAKKYDDNNWRKGFRYGRVFAAMMRHAWNYWRGEDYDLEDGQHHLASVVWCAMTLMEFDRTKVGTDDRVKQ